MTTSKQDELLNYLSDDETRKLAAENLLNNYKASIDTLEKNKKSQQQTADIAMRKMQKYLPQQLKAQGLYGMGVSETAQIDAQNRYVSQLGQIAQENDAKRAAVENDFNQNLLSLYDAHKAEKEAEELATYNRAREIISEWSGSMKDLENYYNDLAISDLYQKDLKAAYNEKIDALYQALVDNAEATYTSDAELKKYLDGIKEDVPDQYKDEFEEYHKDASKYADEKVYAVKFDYVKPGSDTEWRFKVDGTEYTVGRGTPKSAEAHPRIYEAMKNSNVGAGELFYYDGEIYYCNDGVVHQLAAGDWNDWNYQDLKKLLKEKAEGKATDTTKETSIRNEALRPTYANPKNGELKNKQ